MTDVFVPLSNRVITYRPCAEIGCDQMAEMQADRAGEPVKVYFDHARGPGHGAYLRGVIRGRLCCYHRKKKEKLLDGPPNPGKTLDRGSGWRVNSKALVAAGFAQSAIWDSWVEGVIEACES